MGREFEVLTAKQVGHFMEKGYVKLEGCFKKSDIQDWLDLAYVRLGYDRDDPTTMDRGPNPYAWYESPESG